MVVVVVVMVVIVEQSIKDSTGNINDSYKCDSNSDSKSDTESNK
jgi:hypothetical protein